MHLVKRPSLRDTLQVRDRSLRTLGAKIIYLIIRNNADESGWARLSLTELQEASCLTRQGVINILNRMQEEQLIQKQYDHSSQNASNKYKLCDEYQGA